MYFSSSDCAELAHLMSTSDDQLCESQKRALNIGEKKIIC